MATTAAALESMNERWTANRDDAARDQAAREDFAAVATQYRPQIFRFLLASLRDADVAETLTQECLLKAYKNWQSFRGDSQVLTWLLRIAINLQKDQWRNRRLQFWKQTTTHAVDATEAGSWLASDASSPEEQTVARDQVRLVWDAVKRLSERQRTVFMLRHVEQMEITEIAEAVGLSEGTVKAHLSRAVMRVRAELGGKR